MVFQEVAAPQSQKPKNRRDLENELFGGSDLSSQSGLSLRDNEGEAAEHGIYYDDTDYDYMQHMRDLGGNAGGEAIWVEAPGAEQGKGKQKQSLEEALKELDLEHERSAQAAQGKIVDESILPSQELRRQTYQNQQDVPDELAGFQPDMDPRLREVLEALDDEAYVDAEETDDFFSSIATDKRELSLDEFEDRFYYDGENQEEDDGWESDRTARPSDEGGVALPSLSASATPSDLPSSFPTDPHTSAEAQVSDDGTFMSTFRSLPPSLKAPTQAPKSRPSGAAPSLLASSASSLFPPGTKRKKRKGALTATSGYSMTSSSLARTEGLTTLDARFDKILESYENDSDSESDDIDMGMDDTSSLASGTSKLSGLSGMSGKSWKTTTSTKSLSESLAERKDLDGMMDEFLGGYKEVGKRRIRKEGEMGGIRELDEIRRELGPARIRA